LFEEGEQAVFESCMLMVLLYIFHGVQLVLPVELINERFHYLGMGIGKNVKL
jgi:hypothetical protein